METALVVLLFIERWEKPSEIIITLGKHSKPPPVTLSKARDRTLSGTMAANLQAIIAPVLTAKTWVNSQNILIQTLATI